MSTGKGLASRAFDAAVAIAVSVWLLRWSWQELQPLVPLLVFAALVYSFLQWRHR